MLRMSEKSAEHQQKFPSVARKICFGLLGGLGACSLRYTLKIMFPRLAKIAFHGISAVKIKCHLTIYLKHLINLAFFKMRENFPSMRVSVRMYQIACVSRILGRSMNISD